VSHNMGAITRLCERSFWLDQGKLVMDGASGAVVNRYHSQYLTACPEWKRPDGEKAGSDFAFLSVTVKDGGEGPTGIFDGDEPISIKIDYIVHRPLAGCQVSTRIYNSDGVVVFTTSDADDSGASALSKEPGRYSASFAIPESFLAPGVYYLMLGAHLPNRTIYAIVDQTVVFEISPSGSLASLDGRLGIVSPLFHWETHKAL